MEVNRFGPDYPTYGDYTPSGVGVANMQAFTFKNCRWVRFGREVMVFGQVSIDTTLSGVDSQLRFNPPIPSNFGAVEDCTGVISSSTATSGGGVTADATNDAILIKFISGSLTPQDYHFVCGYKII